MQTKSHPKHANYTNTYSEWAKYPKMCFKITIREHDLKEKDCTEKNKNTNVTTLL